MLDPGSYDALTFDCYGTLIDWESGILAGLRPVLEAQGVSMADDDLLETYAELEAEGERGWAPYRQVLRGVVARLGERLGFEASEEQRHCLEDSLPHWPAFGDTVGALHRLQARFRVGVISNVDDDLFDGTALRLETRPDVLVTAQQVRAYKPSPLLFEEALRRLEVPAERVLHCAQSRFHDVAPARALGIPSMWVDRRSGQSGAGATPETDVEPDFRVTSLSELADVLGT